MHVRWCERRKAKAEGCYKPSPRGRAVGTASSDEEGDGEEGLEEDDYEEGEGEGEEGSYGVGDGMDEDNERDEEEEEDDDVEEEGEGDEESDDGAASPYTTTAASSSSSSAATEGVFTHALLNPAGTSIDAAGESSTIFHYYYHQLHYLQLLMTIDAE